jgi:hypothetical protein
MLQSSISTCLLATGVIGGGFTGSCCVQRDLKPQMRITKIERSGELAPIAGWAATNRHPPPSAEPPNYTADALG